MKTLNTRIDHYGPNPNGGRDLAVGDIHGYFSKLHEALVAIDFDIRRDRLFSVGDLVDRGPESDQATSWLTFPWFKACRGNHEEAAIAWARQEIEAWNYARGFGGGWNINSPLSFVQERAAVFETLPIAIEVETRLGLVALVHACCPMQSWEEFRTMMALPEDDTGTLMSRKQAFANMACWNHMERRDRFFDGPVQGVRAVVVGHTEKERLTAWDNTLFIDTGGWNGGRFTIIDLATLLPASRPVPLTWE